MTSDQFPEPDPRGALVPPSRRPPTATGTDTPEPPRGDRVVRTETHWELAPELKRFVNKVLDAVDQVAEKIAVELGVRGPSSRSSPSEPPAA